MATLTRLKTFTVAIHKTSAATLHTGLHERFSLSQDRPCRAVGWRGQALGLNAQLLSEELIPGPDPFGVSRRWEQSATAYRLASGNRHRDHPFALMGGRQVAAEQVLPGRYVRS